MKRALVTPCLLAAFTGFAAHAQTAPTFVTQAMVTIGGDSSAGAAYRFNGLSDVRRISNGALVVAACGDREIRSFDAAGKHVGTLKLGGEREPQRFLYRIMPAGGDSMAAFESLNSRLSVIAPDLTIARTVTIANVTPPRPDGRMSINNMDVIGRLADGSWLGRVHGSATDTGFVRRPMAFYRFDDAGRVGDSVTGFKGSESYRPPSENISREVRIGRTTTAAVVNGALVVGDQMKPEIVEYDRNLRPIRRIPTRTAPAPVTDSIVNAWVATANNRQNFPINGITPVYGPYHADFLPAFRDIVAGTDGRIWVQDPNGAAHYPLIWTAYKDARVNAIVELPARFYPTQFGPDWVTGLAYDTTKVERVQLRRLVPGALSGVRLTPREGAPANRPRCGAWASR